MARLDLYRIAGLDGFLLDVQADLMSDLATAVVVPMLPLDAAPKPVTRLTPIFTVDGERYVMMTPLLASVPRRELGVRIGTLDGDRDFEVTGALDMLLSGT